MIQDIYPKKFKNSFKNYEICKNDYIIVARRNETLIKMQDGEIRLPKYSEITDDKHNDYEKSFRYLFSIDESRFFRFEDEENNIIEDKLYNFGYRFVELRKIRGSKPKWLQFAAATAISLSGWYDHNRFCGCCGNILRHSKVERMLECTKCGNMVYPKISPAVIVGIINGDSILFSKYAGRSYKKYALIAGFTEIGETIEETVSREVKEETGLDVKNIKYYKSQPWAYTDTLLIGFFCELDGKDTINIDENELSEAKWIKRGELEISDEDLSLTNEMMVEFMQKGRDVLEIVH